MQQHGSKYFAHWPTTHAPRPWGWGQNSTFSHSHGAYCQNSTFSEHGHVANQIKWNHECSNIANIFPADPPPTLGVGSTAQNSFFSEPRDQKVKIQLFQNMVMLHINLKGMEHRAPCNHIFSPYTHPQPVGWIKGYKKSECDHVAYQIKGKEI